MIDHFIEIVIHLQQEVLHPQLMGQRQSLPHPPPTATRKVIHLKKRIIYNTTITLATLYTSGGADTRGILAWRSVWSALAAASARAFA